MDTDVDADVRLPGSRGARTHPAHTVPTCIHPLHGACWAPLALTPLQHAEAAAEALHCAHPAPFARPQSVIVCGFIVIKSQMNIHGESSSKQMGNNGRLKAGRQQVVLSKGSKVGIKCRQCLQQHRSTLRAVLGCGNGQEWDERRLYFICVSKQRVSAQNINSECLH